MRILGISGSFRRGSHNSQLLRAAARALPPGVELVLFDGLAAVPPYCEDGDTDPAPEAVEQLRRQIAEADAILIATPEYNASIPGVLKNAIDWASRPFPDNVLRNKPVAVIGASTGLFGAVWAQAEVRKVLHHAGADVLDDELPVALADQAFTPAGDLVDPELERHLAELLEALAREVGAPLALSR
jgi:chromate reductase, NAD(P)H dehydrogenase (quinone)